MIDYKFYPMKKEDLEKCISLVDASFEKNMYSLIHEFENKDISKPPWSWYKQKNVYFYTLNYQNSIIAYVIWRIKGRISHIHSFLVSADFQRKGIGTQLLKFYEKKSEEIHPNLRIFTLHTYDETKYNHMFYSKNNYIKYRYHDENIHICLNDWIKNCKIHNDWPLKDNKVLFYKLNNNHNSSNK